MNKIYSKLDKQLLHIIFKIENICEGRNEISPEDEFLQVSCSMLNCGKKFKAHKHIENIRNSNITQESWIVIVGKIKIFCYDIDDSLIFEDILKKGDCMITFRGGHTMECLEEGTVVYENKLGPYLGHDKDKKNIN
jgi:hypothetical protein